MAYKRNKKSEMRGRRLHDARDEISEMESERLTNKVQSEPRLYRDYQLMRRYNMLRGRPDPKRPY